MILIEQARGLIARGKVQEASVNLLADSASAILGDPVSIGKVLLALAKSPFFIREQLFWMKIEAFLNGVYLSEEDKASAALCDAFQADIKQSVLCPNTLCL